MKVEHKTIVVTGAGSGIGRELALLLLQKNANIVGVDIHLDKLIETREMAKVGEDRFLAVRLDISNREKAEALPLEVIKHFGTVDGIINNAGIIQHFIPVNDLSYEEINKKLHLKSY